MSVPINEFLDQHPKSKSIRRGSQLQRTLALDLHHEAKVVLGPFGYEALTAFSQALEQLDERVLYYDTDST